MTAWPAKTSARRWMVFGLGGALLVVLSVASLGVGPMPITLRAIGAAIFQHDAGNVEHIIVTTTRLSRTVIAVVVGASLAVAGALMQALTRNPLASPSLFGINAGAMFFLVCAAVLLPALPFSVMIWVAFAGAATAGILVALLGTSTLNRAFSLRIVLAGAAITALFAAFTQALLVVNQDGLDSILFWLAGSTAERSLATVAPLFPYLFAALVAVCAAARHLDVLAAGDDIAISLGQHTVWTRALVAVAVICLAGAAVAMAGSIGFVGLIVPHIMRRAVGATHRRLIPACALFGAILLLSADLLSRLVIAPAELPVGVITAALGAPLFIIMIRRGLRHV